MDESKPLSVLIFGAGAIGTYIGGTLIASGQKAAFIEQEAVAVLLCKSGLKLDLSIDKERGLAEALVIPPAEFDVYTSAAQALEHGSYDAAVFAMKSFDTIPALEILKPLAEKMPPVFSLQNGVDNEPAIAAALGAGKVVAGTITCSIGKNGPGDIVLEKARGIGVAGGHPLSERLVEGLNRAQLKARLYPSAADMKWSKVLMNLPGSATSAILDMTPAEVFEDKRLFRLEMRLSREAQAVMAAEGARPVNLPGTPVKLLAMAANLPGAISRPLLAKAVGGGRGGKMPSFHIDLHAGRKQSEINWLHGAVASHGEALGVPVPVSRLLTDTLLAMVRGEIPIEAFSRQPEKLIALVQKK
jgi:2-dehydropantoate 2-reductase